MWSPESDDWSTSVAVRKNKVEQSGTSQMEAGIKGQ